MPYAIITTDDSAQSVARVTLRDAHVRHLEAHMSRLLAAGALLSDDGKPCGSLILLDVEDRAEAEDFINQDPYAAHHVFARIDVIRWRKGFFNFESLLT